jgi:hypothetical protein
MVDDRKPGAPAFLLAGGFCEKQLAGKDAVAPGVRADS